MTNRALPSDFPVWRRIHFGGSLLLCALAALHVALTTTLYRSWSADAVWFMGAGLGLLLLSALNIAHLGVEQCRQPTARFVRWANWSFVLFGIGALLAVPMPQAFAIVGSLLAQAVAAHRTLPGPS
jgi:hypothetical protein